MNGLVFAPCERGHIEELARTMRQADRDEVMLIAGMQPLEALEASVLVSRDTMAALYNGTVAAIFGIRKPTSISLASYPWALTSGEWDKHPRIAVRVSRNIVRHWLENGHPYMMNYVDASHEKAIKWLRLLGFTMYAPEPLNGGQVCKFELGA